jgi:glycosyltransferase involved in cell wall biosynthesis
MNILFVSKLSGKKGCGPYYSIPNQVSAQSSVDNVFWYNMNNVISDDWSQWANVKTCNEYPNSTLQDLPHPFNHPDIVVVEEQYEFFNSKIISEIRKNKIPYIIVPRCSLTAEAQKRKYLKKKIANQIYFNKMIKNAAGIQFLTEQEKIDSGSKWNDNEFVIPNGIEIHNNVKTFNNDKIKMCFIGRIDLHHKGLDLLLKAMSSVKELLKREKVTLDIYGSGSDDQVEKLKKEIIENKLESEVCYKGPIYGQEKENVLLCSDIFVLTSRFEGMPMGLLEALSYGMPVLITKGTNMADFVSNYQAGWASDTSFDGIKHALHCMVDSRSTFLEKSRQAKTVAGLFSWNQIALSTHAEFERIICNRKGVADEKNT